MFAHQVIDDFTSYEKYCKDDVLLSTFRTVSKLIKNSQQFHIGNWGELKHQFKSYYLGKNLFLDPDVSDFIRLPYNTCWFDYTVNHYSAISSPDKGRRSIIIPKRGILAHEIAGDSMCVWMVRFIEGRWIVGRYEHYISIGKPLKESSFHEKFNIPSEMRTQFGSTDLNIMSVATDGIHEYGGYDKSTFRDKVMEYDKYDLACLNVCLMLLSCKNIGAETVYPAVALNKKRKKRGRQPLFSYHTLVLKPVGKKQESIPGNQWNNRIHLQRGHFKTYTVDKPLFGNISGRFWWQPHVRGQNRDGVVMKDYEI
jgi:hypothetical protein